MRFNLLKKVGAIIASLTLVVGVMGTNSFAALEDGTYKVPVHLKKAVEESDSMGAKAVEENAIVTVKDGKPEIKVYFKGLSFMNMYGHILELFYYPKGVDLTSPDKGTPTPAEVVEKWQDEGLHGEKEEFVRAFKIPRDDTDETYIPIRVIVDAMEEIAKSSGQPGRGEQDARLFIDYANAEKTQDTEIPKPSGGNSDVNETKKPGDSNTNETKKTGTTTPSSSSSSKSSTPSSSGSSSTPASSAQKSSSDKASTPDELPKTGSLVNTRGVALASIMFLALGLIIRKKVM